MFQSVYDYPYLSSSANHIFDLTVGYAANSAISASSNIQNAKKINMYNQFTPLSPTSLHPILYQSTNSVLVILCNSLYLRTANSLALASTIMSTLLPYVSM